MWSKENPWHANRESVLLSMRSLDRMAINALQQAKQLTPLPGCLAVGGADFDCQLKAEVYLEYLKALRAGKHPNQCLEDAIAYGRLCVKNWNEKTSLGRVSIGGPHELKRYEGSGDSYAVSANSMFNSFPDPEPANESI